MSLVRVASIGALLAGCVDLPEEEDLAVTEQALANCAGWVCGSNHAQLHLWDFHELHEGGEENAEGFKITKFEKFGWVYKLDVSKGRLSGKSFWGGVIKDNALIGSRIWLKHPNGQFVLRVNAVGQAPYYADHNGAAPNPMVQTYRIEWSPVDPTTGQPAGSWRNVCHKPTLPRKETLGLPGELLVLFEGERISATTKKIEGIDDDWFNIGCAGHALSKMYLTGHAEVAMADGYNTHVPERQTFLRMITADYCGTGVPFTVGGQPLEWMDALGWMKYPPLAVLDLEARWTPTGASCLNTPRIDANWTALGGIVFPNVEGDIANECVRPPPCWANGGNNDVKNLDGHHLNSANP